MDGFGRQLPSSFTHGVRVGVLRAQGTPLKGSMVPASGSGQLLRNSGLLGVPLGGIAAGGPPIHLLKRYLCQEGWLTSLNHQDSRRRGLVSFIRPLRLPTLFRVWEVVLRTRCEPVQTGLLLAGPWEASGQAELILGHLWFPGAGQEFCLEGPVSGNGRASVGLGTSENHGGEVVGGQGHALFLPSFVQLPLSRAGSFLGSRCSGLPTRRRPRGS